MKSIFVCLFFTCFFITLNSQQNNKPMEEVLIQKINAQVQSLEHCEIQASNNRVRPARYGNILFNSLKQIMYDFFFTDRPFIASFRTSISQSFKKWLGFKKNQQCQSTQKLIIKRIKTELQQLFTYVKNQKVQVSLNKLKLGEKSSKLQYKQKCLMFQKVVEDLRIRSDLQILLSQQTKKYFDQVSSMSQEQVEWENDEF